MKRNEIWWADLPPPSGRRPVLLLSRNEAYAIREQITVAPVTTRIRRIPAELPLGPQDGLPKRCVANLDSIVTIDKSCQSQRITRLKPAQVQAVDQAIRFALNLAG